MFSSGIISLQTNELLLAFLVVQVCRWQILLVFMYLKHLYFAIILDGYFLLGIEFWADRFPPPTINTTIFCPPLEETAVFWIIITLFVIYCLSPRAFKIFSLSLFFGSLTLMCLSLVFFYVTCLKFSEILRSVNLCLSSNLGIFLAFIFSNNFFLSHFHSSLLSTNCMNVRNSDIIYRLYDFCLCSSDWIFYVDLFLDSLPLSCVFSFQLLSSSN